MAIWYWHFVDVVWIFVFIFIYWWGNSIPFSLMNVDNFWYLYNDEFSSFLDENKWNVLNVFIGLYINGESNPSMTSHNIFS